MILSDYICCIKQILHQIKLPKPKLHLPTISNLLNQNPRLIIDDESELLTFCSKDHQLCTYLLYYDPMETKCSKNLHPNSA